MCKRILCILVLLCSLVCLFPLTVNAEVVSEELIPESDFSYVMQADQTVHINRYNGTGVNLVIPELISGLPVVSIGSSCFADHPQIESIYIPIFVKKIEYEAFRNCTGLKEITISNSGATIGNRTFLGCTNLEKVILPKNLTSLGNNAFDGCTSLKTIEIPKSMANSKSTDVFVNSGLESVTFEEGITRIPALFTGAENLKNISIPESATCISKNAFKNCTSITELNLPSSIIHIEEAAFKGCTSLTDIGFSEGLLKIDYETFSGCTALKEVDLPDSVTYIGTYAFKDCTSLLKVSMPANLLEMYTSPFSGCTNLKTLQIPKALQKVNRCFADCSLETITFEEGTTLIPEKLFYEAKSVKSVKLPETLETIQNAAFRDCTALESISIPASVTKIGSYAFSGCTALSEAALSGVIGESMFRDCTSLKEIVIPEGVETVAMYAFTNCTALEKVLLPQSLTHISGNAFDGCTVLTDIKLPEGLKFLDAYAFRNCDSITEIALGAAIESLESSGVFYDCDSLETFTMSDTPKLLYVGYDFFSDCDALKNVTLSRSVKSIEARAFQNCASLEEITLPYHVATIYANAFGSCPKLKKVVMNRSVTFVDPSAFSYPGLTTIYGVAGTYPQTWADANGFDFVENEVHAESLTLNTTELTIECGKTERLMLSVSPADTTDVLTWRIRDEGVVTVDEFGRVKAGSKTGTTTIDVYIGDAGAACTVTVIKKATSVNLNSTTLTLAGGDTYQLKATVDPWDVEQDVTWESSDPAIATVDENGLVTGIGQGEAVITATSVNNPDVSRTCNVTVTSNFHIADTAEGLESPHNYPSNCADVWTYTLDDAQGLNVTFDAQTEIEAGYDSLVIYDGEGNTVGTYSGTELAGQTIFVPGDTIRIKLISDQAGNKWGFKVSELTAAILCDHVVTEWITVTEATCTEAGQETGTCTCGENIETREIEALGHTAELDAASAPSCTQEGLTEGSHCSVCGETLVAQESIPMIEHDYVDGFCTMCGAEDPNCYHVNTYLENERKATCTEDGYTGDTICEDCGEVLATGEIIFATGHAVEINKAREPSCTETGLTEGTYCMVCKQVFTEQEEIPMIPHNYENGFCTECNAEEPACKHPASHTENATQADCVNDGYTGDLVCDVCGEILENGTSIAASGHSFESGFCTVCGQACEHPSTYLDNGYEPTCTEDGYEGDHVCEECGMIVSRGETIPATGHNYTLNGICINCWQSKPECGHASTHKDNASEATCTEDGYTGDDVCDACGEMVSQGDVIPAMGHNYQWGYCTRCWAAEPQCEHPDVVVKYASDATCTEEGYTGNTFCKICNEMVTKGEAIPPLGHTYEYGSCIRCGEMEPQCEHLITIVKNEVNATCTEDGYSGDTVCQTCDEVVAAGKVIPALGHTYEDGGCTVCGEKEPGCSHSQTHTENAVEASCIQEGYSGDTYCELCGEMIEEGQTIPNTEHSIANGRCTVCGQSELMLSGKVTRLFGTNRFTTAFAVADKMKENLGIDKFDAIIVASGTNFADALSGSYLAAVKNAPILLSFNETYNNLAKDYIRNNLKEGGTVYILGGSAAVPPAMETGLDGFQVRRLDGRDRFETNQSILLEAGVGKKPVLVCTGLSFADSLSASASELPILLVWNKLTDMQKAFLKSLNGNPIYVIGGESAVSKSMEQELTQYGSVTRIGGGNRFETSVAIARQFFDKPESAVMAYAWNYPDGLCGGALAATIDAPLILTMNNYESAASAYVKDCSIERGTILGGDSLISEDAILKIFP